MAIDEANDYEKQRQANIAERDKLLKDLNLGGAAAAIAPKKNRTPVSRSKKSAPKKIKQEVIPSRKSSRLAGIEADSEVAKRKAEEDYQVAQEVARVKRQRKTDDLSLDEIVVNGHGWNKNANAFVDLINRGATPYERTFGETEVKESSTKELKALREKMGGLKIYETFEPNRIKITPERIYAMAFHPEPSKALIFAGDKMGNFGIFDASQTPEQIKGEDDDDEVDLPDPEITTFKVHTRTITAFQISPNNPSHIFTSSYDSSIRQMDLATGTATEIYGPSDKEADEPISAFEIDPKQPQLLYFSRLDGHLGRHDTREAPHIATKIWQLSEKKIGGFSIHPLYSHFLATASLDRTMALWDIRKINSKPVQLGEHTSRLSVSHAAFNSVGQVATSSYDDTIKVYNYENMGSWKAGTKLTDEQMDPTHIIKHNNQTGRWVTILRPQWQARPVDGVQRFVIGNMNRFVDVYSGSGDQLAQLGGDGITAVPAVAQFHPTQDWIAAGTASGKLCLWM